MSSMRHGRHPGGNHTGRCAVELSGRHAPASGRIAEKGAVVVFKVMTWNVENLVRVGQLSGPTTAAVYDNKLSGLATAINEQAPDALALQEVGAPAALDDLMAL